MEKSQYEEMREFTRTLMNKRTLIADGQLLDKCQEYLDQCLSHLADEFEEAPHINEAEPPKKRSHHKKKVP